MPHCVTGLTPSLRIFIREINNRSRSTVQLIGGLGWNPTIFSWIQRRELLHGLDPSLDYGHSVLPAPPSNIENMQILEQHPYFECLPMAKSSPLLVERSPVIFVATTSVMPISLTGFWLSNPAQTVLLTTHDMISCIPECFELVARYHRENHPDSAMNVGRITARLSINQRN